MCPSGTEEYLKFKYFHFNTNLIFGFQSLTRRIVLSESISRFFFRASCRWPNQVSPPILLVSGPFGTSGSPSRSTVKVSHLNSNFKIPLDG